MRVIANGRPYGVVEETSVATFIRQRGLNPRQVVVEHNGEPLERSRYEQVRLADGDRLELVRAVAGGASEERRERLERARLYVVTDSRVRRGDLEVFLDAILGAGVDVVQLREKGVAAGDLVRWGAVFREAADRHGALFIVNDRPDVAVAVGADGVHLGQSDVPVETARRILSPDAVIGVSTQRARDLEAVAADADYVTAGPVWPTPTKPGRPAAGLEHVRHLAEHEERPWFAIGGITPRNLPEVRAAGAGRIAVVRAVTEADDPATAVKELRRGLPDGDGLSGARS